MLKTKNAVLIDAMRKEEKVVFFDLMIFNYDETNDKVIMLLSVCLKQENGFFHDIQRVSSTKTIGKFLEKYGEIKFKDFSSKKDQIIRDIMDEEGLWGMSSEDLEAVE